MSKKPFTAAALIILGLVAVMHVVRLSLGWSVTIDGVDIPMWVSWAGLVIAGGVAIGLWQEIQ